MSSATRRRRCRRRLTAGAALALALFAGGCGPRPARFRNLVLVVVDTLRSDHLPSYGYGRPTAPFLGRLAAEGWQVQGYAASSWTKPAVATVLTGLHPQRHQAVTPTEVLPDQAPYLPAILTARGFTARGYTANGNVGRKFGFARGFSRFRMWRDRRKADGAEVTRAALELAADLRSPYFLYVHYMDPHDPYQPARAWDPDLQPAAYVQPHPLLRAPGSFTAADVTRLRDQYDGEIAEADAAIADLVAGLERRGLLADTLLVVTSDHGEEFGEHGYLLHGFSLYEEVVRVPLLLWGPGRIPARRVEGRLPQVDLLPTLLAALGVQAPAGLDGRSRWPELQAGGPLADADLHLHLDLDGVAALGLLRRPLKLVHTGGTPPTELYDLEGDPAESRALPLPDPRAEALFLDLVRHHNRLAARAYPRLSRRLDSELRANLAALGYLRPGDPRREPHRRWLPPRLDPARGLTADPPPGVPAPASAPRP